MKTVEFERPDGSPLKIEIIKYHPEDLSRNRTPDRHRHNFYSIFFILSGKSVQEIDFQDYEIEQNQIMLIPKGAVHWEKEMVNLSGYIILFKAEFFSNPQKELLDGLLQYAVALRKLLIPIPEGELKNLTYYFQLLFEEQKVTENQNQTFILQNLMLALLNKLEGMIQRLPEKNSFLSQRRPFQRFIKLVEKSFTQQNGLDYYASELQITKRKLNETIKEVTGQTANNFVIDRIMLEA